jgi:ribonuclease-3 family protein
MAYLKGREEDLSETFEKIDDSLFCRSDSAPLNEIPVDIFAYVGDAVFNLYCVLSSIDDGRKDVSKADHEAAKWKSARGQDRLLSSLQNTLTPEEVAFVKRGRNSRGARKKGNDFEYRNSTGFEVLIGYLYLKRDHQRLRELFEQMEHFKKELEQTP